MRHLKRKKAKLYKLTFLAKALIINFKIITSLKNVKLLVPYIEKIITLSRKYNLIQDSTRKRFIFRLILMKLKEKFLCYQLLHIISKNFLKYASGHVKIYKLYSVSCKNVMIKFFFDYERKK